LVELLREPFFVPENVLDNLFKDLSMKSHLAIVLMNGGTSGLVLSL
jgi:Mg2+/Co2+ transporter CorC